MSSGREGRVTQFLAISDGRRVELSQWLAVSSRREKSCGIDPEHCSHKSTRTVRRELVLTYSGRCERGHTREIFTAARDVSGSWVSASTVRERGEMVHGLR